MSRAAGPAVTADTSAAADVNAASDTHGPTGAREADTHRLAGAHAADTHGPADAHTAGAHGPAGAHAGDPAEPTDVGAFAPAAELLRALASPLRIAIVMRLAENAQCVHELVDALGVPQPLVSQHLRVLRAADVVVSRRRGREVDYSLADSHVAHVVRDAVAHSAHPPA